MAKRVAITYMQKYPILYIMACCLCAGSLGGCGAGHREDGAILVEAEIAARTRILERGEAEGNLRVYDAAIQLGRIGLSYRLPDRTVAALARLAQDPSVATVECCDYMVSPLGGGTLVYLNRDAAHIAFLMKDLKEAPDDSGRVHLLWRKLTDEGGGAGIRKFCIDQLAPIGAGAMPYLAAAACDSGKAASWYVRGVAIMSLGKMMPPSRDVLVQLAYSDTAAGSIARDVLTDIDIALSGCYPQDTEPLETRVRSPKWEVRRRAVMAVAKRRPPEGLQLVLESLKDDECLVRQAAALALGRLGDKGALRALRGATKDASFLVRLAAYEAIGLLGVNTDTELLRQAMADPWAEARWWGVRQLAYNNSADSVPMELLQRAADDVDSGVRSLSIKVLAACSRDVLDILLNALWDPEGMVRIEAVQALGKRKEAKAIDGLCSLVTGDDAPSIRVAAAEALAAIGDLASGHCLVGALEDEEPEVRAAAATALGQIGCCAAMERLIGLAQNDPHQTVREAAVAAVNRLRRQAKCPREFR